ncbi:Replication factor A protein 1 [Orbilia blumenaviensis]|uniref:Replication protein A subunit n=1 Tax=Orbilia blumenaviensis TaxID=1796055 RepID=A0AAV9VA18_9PEZI
MATLLSGGSLAAIFAAGCENPKEAWKDPIMQVLLVKKIEAQGKTPERYRIVVSDGIHFTQGMIASQSNYLMADGKIQRGSIVRMKEYEAGKVKDKSVLIVLALELAQDKAEEKIGDPKQVMPESAAELAQQRVAQEATSTSNFYGNRPSLANRSAGAAGPSRSSAPSARGQSTGISAIESLSPYQNRWAIKARCTFRSEIKNWKNAKGDGKLFTVNLKDYSGEIRATGFGDQVDALYHVFEEGSVYRVSKCKVGIAKRQFSNVDNDYELTFDRDSEVQREDDDDDVPHQTYNFVTLQALQDTVKDAQIDVIGILKDIGDVSTLTSAKTQKEFTKREVTLVDDTGYSVKLSVWGKSAEKFEVLPESVLALKGVKVSDFGGRSLSMQNSSTMQVDPDLEEAHRLKGWFAGEGRDSHFSSHQGMGGSGGAADRPSAFKTIQQAFDENVGFGETADFYTLKATISYIKSENYSYPACKSEGCSKKVLEISDNNWRCEKCNMSWTEPEWRYILTCSAYDHTGQTWLNVFDDAGKIIIGMSATDLQNVRQYDDVDYETTMKSAASQTWIFRIRAHQEVYQDTPRVRNRVLSVQKVDYAAECNRMIDIINLYS